MARMDGKIVINDLRGGRNGTDPPFTLPANQCTEALNVDWYEGALGRPRPGSNTVTQTGGTAFASGMQALFSFPPDDTSTHYLIGVDGAPILKALLTEVGGWSNSTLRDAISSTPAEIEAVTLNNNLYIAYDSAVDRLHALDLLIGSNTVRRVGIDAGTTAPTMADTGAGAWPATIRYYRVRFAQLSGTVVIRRSEPTSSASFTPSGGGAATRITKPATPANEDITHWQFEASSDN